MKSFYEFYRVIQAKKLFEQEMADPMAANAAAPPAQGGVPAGAGMPNAAAGDMAPAGGAQAAPAGKVTLGGEADAEAGSEEDTSNVSPSEGELDMSTVNQALESLQGMVDNFKSMDEEKGAQVEELVTQLNSLIKSMTGEEETGQGEGEEDQAPEDQGNGMSPIPPGGAGMESPEGAGDLGGQGGMPASPGEGTSQAGAGGAGGMGMAGGAAATGGPPMA